ncbi:MAG: thiamine diphosphokinase, partial [Clostridiales bacterium]|nr:thiamine diphosphokinase [Clostridiales bacterium]
LNLPLDFIVGDFDSVPKEIIERYKRNNVPTITFPIEKDKTDTELAIELAIEHHGKSIDIVGATGSRLDHTLANMNLLTIPLDQGIEAYIIDANNKFYLKKENFVIQKTNQYGDYISFLPFHGDVKGLSLRGFKYPLDNIILSPGESLCISNELIDDTGEVLLSQGTLMVFETKD